VAGREWRARTEMLLVPNPGFLQKSGLFVERKEDALRSLNTRAKSAYGTH